MKLTKLDMAKVIVTALYNLDNLVNDNQKVIMKHAISMAKKMKVNEITDQYNLAYKILINRSK